MKPALIKYSDESRESGVWAKACGVPLSETLSATIRILRRLNIKLPPTGNRQSESSHFNQLKLHRNTSKDAALHYGRRGVYEIRHKFQVPVIQQVLAADRQFQACYRPPAQMRIQRVVIGQVQAGKAVHKSQSRVLLEMFRQVDG